MNYSLLTSISAGFAMMYALVGDAVKIALAYAYTLHASFILFGADVDDGPLVFSYNSKQNLTFACIECIVNMFVRIRIHPHAYTNLLFYIFGMAY